MSIDGNGRKPDGKFGEGNQAARGRRTLRKTARELFKSDLSTAIGVLRELLQDSRRPEVRLQAAKLILEYSLGKPIATNLVAAANASGGRGLRRGRGGRDGRTYRVTRYACFTALRTA